MRFVKICGVLAGILLLAPGFSTRGQTTAVGARSASMAGMVAGLEDAWAVNNNPAGLARFNHFSLATTFEQKFLMKELGCYGVAATFPSKNGCLGLLAIFSGYQSFIDQKFSLGYGRLFGKNLLTGISLVYVFRKAGDQSKPVHQVSYELGTIVLISEKFKLAFVTFNPFQLYFKSEEYASLPSIFTLGLSYQYNSSLAFHTQIEKDLDLPLAYKIGMEYFFNKYFIIRGGIRGFPFSWSFGTAIRSNSFLIEFASSYHQFLGFTPNVTLQYNIK
jgi:hypothetical protein